MRINVLVKCACVAAAISIACPTHAVSIEELQHNRKKLETVSLFGQYMSAAMASTGTSATYSSPLIYINPTSKNSPKYHDLSLDQYIRSTRTQYYYHVTQPYMSDVIPAVVLVNETEGKKYEDPALIWSSGYLSPS